MADGTPISALLRDHAEEAVLLHEQERALTTNYYLDLVPFSSGQRLPIPRQNVVADQPTIMAFADDAPLYNWGHRCRYLLLTTKTAEFYREIPAQFPPYAGDIQKRLTFPCFHQPVQHPKSKHRVLVSKPVKRIRATGVRYAILLSGMSNYRHVNDLEFLYRTLIHRYGYEEENIQVMNYDGTLNYDGDPLPVPSNWPGDGTPYQMEIKSQGSKDALLTHLDTLKTLLKPPDSLLIHTSNHGGFTTESDLCCYPSYDLAHSITVKDFADKLAELPPYRSLMIMMEQCYSGGFHDKVLSASTAANTSIASACEADKTSKGGDEFDPFAKCWISAMASQDPSGISIDADFNLDKRLSSVEAFDYALDYGDPEDTPVFDETGKGDTDILGVDKLRWPSELPIIEPELRELWPGDDPHTEQQLELLLPELKKLEEALREQHGHLKQNVIERLRNLIKGSK